MRILLCSHWFFPSFGGVETVSKILAEEFVKYGAQVTVVTGTSGPQFTASYSVVRQPTQRALRSLAANSDAILQNMISLRTLVPLLLSRKPIVVTHHSWLRRSNGARGIENYAKLIALRGLYNVAISRSIAESLPVRAEIIRNPFEAAEFLPFADAPRDRDIVFLGRLVSDKGCDLLLRSLARLKDRGINATLSIIGDGPEMMSLKALAFELELTRQVEFFGAIREGRGAIVSRHRAMVIPSLWSEPFGLVALEGIASGCAIVASSRGGLPEAAGPCGLYFPNGDVDALTSTLYKVLSDSPLQQKLASRGPEHLKQFEPAAIAQRYLSLFHDLVSK